MGTSGYNYPEWKGTFYPNPFPAARMFDFYAARFRTVEINYTFYRMPTPTLAARWSAQAPAGFTYTLKAPKRLTHDRRLADCEALLAEFVVSARGLDGHLGCLLFQLPPQFRADPGRLAAFLDLLPGDVRAAVEFRHESWHTDATFHVLSDRNVALCIADMGDTTTPLVATARHGYFRLRDEGYGPADIQRWVTVVSGFADQWSDAFVYFKHEDEGKGPEFARVFLDGLSITDR